MWDYDLATVDCWQFYSTCHCLQRSRQFELGAREVCTRAGVARGRVSCSTERVPAWGVGGGGAGGGSSSGTNETSCCRTTAEPARPLTITVCAGRWGGGGCGGGSGGGAGLSGKRPARELAEWRSQGSELAEWRSQVRELAESAAGCRTVKSGCRTVSAQAVHISTHWDWELWVSPERGCSPVEVRLCTVSLASDSQCSLFLCLSRRLLQRTSQGAGWAMGQWVVERWPTMHSNSASKMGAARNWVLRGHCQADPTGFLSGSTLCSRTRGVLQAEGREGGLGQEGETSASSDAGKGATQCGGSSPGEDNRAGGGSSTSGCSCIGGGRGKGGNSTDRGCYIGEQLHGWRQ